MSIYIHKYRHIYKYRQIYNRQATVRKLLSVLVHSSACSLLSGITAVNYTSLVTRH